MGGWQHEGSRMLFMMRMAINAHSLVISLLAHNYIFIVHRVRSYKDALVRFANLGA